MPGTQYAFKVTFFRCDEPKDEQMSFIFVAESLVGAIQQAEQHMNNVLNSHLPPRHQYSPDPDYWDIKRVDCLECLEVVTPA